MTPTFIAPGGTVFTHSAGYAGDVHIAPGIDEPSVEIPLADALAFFEHVVGERRSALERDAKKRWRR